MRTNPMVKPQTSSGWAVTLTAISCVFLATAIRLFLAQQAPALVGWVLVAAAVMLASIAAAIWFTKIRRFNAWITHAVQQWEHFSTVKSQLGVTTEITVLDIHSLDPTGTWITIRWEKFGYVQRAWMEAVPDELIATSASRGGNAVLGYIGTPAIKQLDAIRCVGAPRKLPLSRLCRGTSRSSQRVSSPR